MLTGLPDLSKGAIAQPTTYNIVNTEELFTIMPEKVAELYLSYAPGLTMFDILTFALDGRSDLVSSESYESFIEDYPIKTMTVGSIDTQGTVPGGVAKFVLSATDLTRLGSTSTYYYYPRERQTCFLQKKTDASDILQAEIVVGGITASTSTVTVTIRPSDITATLTSDYLYANQVIPLGGFATGVESTGVQASKVGYDHVYFYAQLFKEAQGFGGMELARKHWYNIDGKYYYERDVLRKELELRAGMNAALILGQETTNTSIVDTSVLDSSSVPIYTNIGLWEWGGQKGYDKSYSSTAGFLITDFDATSEYWLSVGVSTPNIICIMGNGLYTTMENNTKDYVSGTTGSLNQLFTPNAGAEGDKRLEIGFKSIRKDGFNYFLVQDHSFNNPYLLKNVMYNNGLMFPLSQVKTRDGAYVPNLSVRYCGNKTYNRRMVIGHLNGMDNYFGQTLGLPILNSNDANATHWLSHASFPYLNAFQTIRVYPV